MTNHLRATFKKEGTVVDADGRHPFLLADPNTVWMVSKRKVDLFYNGVKDGETASPRTYLQTIDEGELIFGIGMGSEDFGLVAVGVVGAELIKFDYQRLRELTVEPDCQDEAILQIERWITKMYEGLGHTRAIPKAAEKSLDVNTTIELEQDQIAIDIKSTSVCWTKLTKGASMFEGIVEIDLEPSDIYLPIIRGQWISALQDSSIQTLDIRSLIRNQEDGTALRFSIVSFLIGQRSSMIERRNTKRSVFKIAPRLTKVLRVMLSRFLHLYLI
ncbi:MAG: hypothetical protein JKX97_01795 [Candidatus Lindowbacteria bacterium]|nr:hypothetical protein [Candidatus Lindowbacteria bacterium]